MFCKISKNRSVLLVLYVLLGVSAKAQVSSSRSPTAFYNDNVRKKLAENTAGKSQSQNGNFRSNDPLLGNMANSKVNQSGVPLQKKSSRTKQTGKRKLPSNSDDLKQKGHPTIKPKQVR